MLTGFSNLSYFSAEGTLFDLGFKILLILVTSKIYYVGFYPILDWFVF